MLLGERGQAKTRIARSLVELLDPEIPSIAGCEINDGPYEPICLACRERVNADGDDVPIEWISRHQRYGEKLATPDITIADLIGEVDPIRVAEGTLPLRRVDHTLRIDPAHQSRNILHQRVARSG